ncbi:MAG: lactonase family protein [Cytophagales bacterium]|nr:lactonase family protein [Cytophagales bacterium]
MRFYTGSYNQENSPAQCPSGDGIGICFLDPITGQISADECQSHRNPSYLCISSDNKCLFAAEELPGGSGTPAISYEICNDTGLGIIDSKEIPGGYACYLAIYAGRLVIANYMSGNALSVEILNGGFLSGHLQVIQNFGSWPNKLRQESAHMIYPWERDKSFIVDLSQDSNDLVVFSVNIENGLLFKHSAVNVNTPVNVCFQQSS